MATRALKVERRLRSGTPFFVVVIVVEVQSQVFHQGLETGNLLVHSVDFAARFLLTGKDFLVQTLERSSQLCKSKVDVVLTI